MYPSTYNQNTNGSNGRSAGRTGGTRVGSIITYSPDGGHDSVSARLHDYLDNDEINELYQLFQADDGDADAVDAGDGKKFTATEFREILLKFRIFMSDDEYKTFFLKIDSNKDNHCDWDEFISYLILGFQRDDPYTQKETLRVPIEGVPIVRRSKHTHPIVRILFCPAVLPDRSIDYDHGNYITISKDGTINYWNVNFEFSKSVQSKNPNLKVAKTWILDCCALPDVQIILTSSTEHDLRFYDTTANNFQLRFVISSLPFAVSSLSYWFSTAIATNNNNNTGGENTTSKIIMGDFYGNVYMLEFNSHLRGPFQSRPGTTLLQLTWLEFIQGDKMPLIKITEFGRLHIDIVRQVEYCRHLNAIISVAECPAAGIGKLAGPSLVLCYLNVQQKRIVFRANKGMTCFAFDSTNATIATGGPDTIIRVWNPIKPQKPIGIFPGHHAGITLIFIQTHGQKLYSLDKNKIIKIWDIMEQNLLQTYILMGSALPDSCDICGCYNDRTRNLYLGGMRLANVKCSALIDLSQTDGQTHARAVSVILYNELFKTIVTCGFDSFIIVWDPWTGKRLTLIRMAHTREIDGELKRVEITAACFDPKWQLLMTGARDGTCKIWNFNNGICVRNFSIESMCEVTAVFWIDDRLLAVGWNKHVTEFSNNQNAKYSNGKNWEQCHNADILCAATREPQTMATCSYNGELLLWKLETGQPYRCYDVERPEARIKINDENQNKDTKNFPKEKRYDISSKKPMLTRYGSEDQLTEQNTRQISIIQMPSRSALMQPLAIHSTLFLSNRPMLPEYGTLLAGLSNGVIQVYSHHVLGGYRNVWNAIHMAGDCVTSMQTDLENKYLFTGHALGYIKIWLIVNYCIPENKRIHINRPELRLKFPFLQKDQWEGRAKRSVRGQFNPWLLNSFKAHTKPINDLVYINESEILVSASSDHSVRLWTIGGRYIGTLGSPVPYDELSITQHQHEQYQYRLPPDIKRVASSTTLKVLNGGRTTNQFDSLLLLRDDGSKHQSAKKYRNDELKKETTSTTGVIKDFGDDDGDGDANINKIPNYGHGKPLEEPILGKHFQLPSRGTIPSKPIFDLSLPYIPVYSHLNYHEVNEIKTVKLPPSVLKRTSKSSNN